jgi:hypothetical protein
VWIAYLCTLKAFQVKADVTNDDVLDSGQNIQSNKKVDLMAVTPNRLRAEISGDGFHPHHALRRKVRATSTGSEGTMEEQFGSVIGSS